MDAAVQKLKGMVEADPSNRSWLSQRKSWFVFICSGHVVLLAALHLLAVQGAAASCKRS